MTKCQTRQIIFSNDEKCFFILMMKLTSKDFSSFGVFIATFLEDFYAMERYLSNFCNVPN